MAWIAPHHDLSIIVNTECAAEGECFAAHRPWRDNLALDKARYCHKECRSQRWSKVALADNALA
ncbi:hypothetical protein VH1709_contig00215-0001 [Vibrio harveyi]|nr:hypothetical protein VH1709_contig00215-0001 [Vibrio harveyi]